MSLPSLNTAARVGVKIGSALVVDAEAAAPRADWPLLYPESDLISLDRECHDRLVNLLPALDIAQPSHFTQRHQ